MKDVRKKEPELIFGTLTLSPLQRNLHSSAGARLMRHAFDRGITFFDTAELYGNDQALALFLKEVPRSQVQIATKSYAYDEATARASVKKALAQMKTDYLDVFLLHEQESDHTLRGHAGALEALVAMKKEGLVRAVGISTHHVAAVKAALAWPAVEVIHPIVNPLGFGLVDGTMEDLLPLLEEAAAMGKTLYGMKPLAGGHLIGDYERAMDYVLGMPFLQGVALGMGSVEEIDANVHYVRHRNTQHPAFDQLKKKKRRLMIHDWCTGCEACVSACGQGALVLRGEKMTVDASRCVLCGYCGPRCPHVCIKVV